MKTKRREVWVNDREGVLGGTCEEARSDAAMLGGRPVKFVESRPGDVVLPREAVKRAAELLSRVEALTGWGDGNEAKMAGEELRALLRGGR